MTRADKIIFVLTILASLILILFSNVLLESSTAVYAIVEVDGNVYGKYELGREKNPKILEIETEYGYNKVVIDDGAEILESDCKDGYCRHRKITKEGAMIVCLPSRLVVRIAGRIGVDGVAY